MNENALSILKELNKNGFDAFIVGGAVRDMIMNIEPHDWDISTNATPEEVQKIFNKTFNKGIEFGTVGVFVENDQFEVTTFRTDGRYSDSRHPEEVSWAKTIEEDLSRRDLTINAIAMDQFGNVIDPFNGQEDIKNKRINTVGNPLDRFSEDPLRMLRAIRFSAKLDFTLDDEVLNVIKENAEKITLISQERLKDELTKLITSDHPEKIDLLTKRNSQNKSIADYIFPELQAMVDCEQNSPHHIYDVGHHSIEAMKFVPNEPNLRWATLLHDVGKPEVKAVNDKGFDTFYKHSEKSEEISRDLLKRFKFSNKDVQQISDLARNHDTRIKKPGKLREFIANHDPEFIDQLKLIQMADILAQSEFQREEKIQQLDSFFNDVDKIIKEGSVIQKKDIKINGTDLKALGFKGKDIGDFLNNAYKQILGNPDLNTHAHLMLSASKQADKLGFGNELSKDIIQAEKEVKEIKKNYFKQNDFSNNHKLNVQQQIQKDHFDHLEEINKDEETDHDDDFDLAD